MVATLEWIRQIFDPWSVLVGTAVVEAVATVAEILGGLGLESAPLPFVSDHEVELETTHAMAGNPSRFSLGIVPLRLDVAWEESQSASERRLVTALTWPLLQRYGYLSD